MGAYIWRIVGAYTGHRRRTYALLVNIRPPANSFEPVQSEICFYDIITISPITPSECIITMYYLTWVIYGQTYGEMLVHPCWLNSPLHLTLGRCRQREGEREREPQCPPLMTRCSPTPPSSRSPQPPPSVFLTDPPISSLGTSFDPLSSPMSSQVR